MLPRRDLNLRTLPSEYASKCVLYGIDYGVQTTNLQSVRTKLTKMDILVKQELSNHGIDRLQVKWRIFQWIYEPKGHLYGRLITSYIISLTNGHFQPVRTLSGIGQDRYGRTVLSKVSSQMQLSNVMKELLDFT